MKLLPTPKPVSLRKLLVGAAVRSVLIPACLVGSYAFGHVFALEDEPLPPQHGAVQLGEPSKAERLLERHDCWTGEAPADMAGVIPGHVVYSHGDGAKLGGPKVVGAALDQIFGGADTSLTVHGFCR